MQSFKTYLFLINIYSKLGLNEQSIVGPRMNIKGHTAHYNLCMGCQTRQKATYMLLTTFFSGCICLLYIWHIIMPYAYIIAISIIESVDSISRDGTDTPIYVIPKYLKTYNL